METNTELTIAITTGHGGFFGLNANNDLIVGNKYQRVNLGPLTQQRVKELQGYLQQLSIHVPER